MRPLAALIERLAYNPDETVVLIYWTDKDALLPELDKAAQTVGGDVRVEAQVPFGRGYLLLVSMGLPKGGRIISSPF